MSNPGKSTCNKCGSNERYRGEAGLFFCKNCDEWLEPECFPDRPIAAPVRPYDALAEARDKALEEAAKVAEICDLMVPLTTGTACGASAAATQIAAHIRKLKEKP